MSTTIASASEKRPFVLVCVACGRQKELPVSPAECDRDGWLHCNDNGACRATKFFVRLRVPLTKTEPAA